VYVITGDALERAREAVLHRLEEDGSAEDKDAEER
jgi:hypothetical protein